MPSCRFFETPQGRKLAYHQTEGAGPKIVFLSGFKSDMQGTKALRSLTVVLETGRGMPLQCWPV